MAKAAAKKAAAGEYSRWHNIERIVDSHQWFWPDAVAYFHASILHFHHFDVHHHSQTHTLTF
jgi:hypothetical protein